MSEVNDNISQENSEDDSPISPFLIGIGEGGGNLLKEILKKDKNKLIMKVVQNRYLAMNTGPELGSLDIKNDHKVMYGMTEQGAGGAPGRGKSLLNDGWNTISTKLNDLGARKCNLFVIFTALAGGTGCGGVPQLIKHLKKSYNNPYICLFGILPFKFEKGADMNLIWALNEIMSITDIERAEKNPRTLLFLLSNEYMLHRLGRTTEDTEYSIDIAKKFFKMVNPIAAKVIQLVLAPGLLGSKLSSGREVHKVADLMDYANKLDPIVVACINENCNFSDSESIESLIHTTLSEARYEEENFIGPTVYLAHPPEAFKAFFVAWGSPDFANFSILEKMHDILEDEHKNYVLESSEDSMIISGKPPNRLMIILGAPKIIEFLFWINSAYKKLAKARKSRRLIERMEGNYVLNFKDMAKALVRFDNYIKQLDQERIDSKEEFTSTEAMADIKSFLEDGEDKIK